MFNNSTSIIPRVVVVTRETEFEMLLAQHATRGQVEFFLQTRGQTIEQVEMRHQFFLQALQQVMASIPTDWRHNHVKRAELDRFLFEPEDLVVAIGQDGLVANTAKYLNGQTVIGVNPDKRYYDGVLVPFTAQQASEMLVSAMHADVDIEKRSMARVSIDNGESLYALNELFIGHKSHQSARYKIITTEREEKHSSSGVIVTTGTGATGWARSIHRQRHDKLQLPKPEDDYLAYYVREAFPSVATSTHLTSGLINAQNTLEIISENNEGGVIFGDGMEADYLSFNWGVRARFDIAEKHLAMVKHEEVTATEVFSLTA